MAKCVKLYSRMDMSRNYLEQTLWFCGLLLELKMTYPKGTDKLEELAASVNPVRQKNNPVPLGHDVLLGIYERILSR